MTDFKLNHANHSPNFHLTQKGVLFLAFLIKDHRSKRNSESKYSQKKIANKWNLRSSGSWSTGVCSSLPCTDVLKRLLPFIVLFFPTKPHLTMWNLSVSGRVNCFKENVQDLAFFYFFLTLFIFLNIKFPCLAIKLKNEMVSTTYQINQLSATQNIKVCLQYIYIFFFFLLSSMCPFKLRNCSTKMNQWPT